jgi:hypothetical protein
MSDRHEGKRYFGRQRRGSVDNTEMDLKEMGFEGVNRIQQDQDRIDWRALMNCVNALEPIGKYMYHLL